MKKNNVYAIILLIISGIIINDATAYARKPYYETDYSDEYYPDEEVGYAEEGSRRSSVAKGVGIGAMSGGLLGLAASGGKGKGFAYGALGGAAFGGIMGSLTNARKKGRVKSASRKRSYQKNYELKGARYSK